MGNSKRIEKFLLNEIKGQTVQDAVNTCNPRFYEWLKKTIKLDISRTIQVSTFLLNLTISRNHFPWFGSIEKVPLYYTSFYLYLLILVLLKSQKKYKLEMNYLF